MPEESPELVVMLLKEAFEHMLNAYRLKRKELACEFEGALIERNRPLLDELERDIKISLSRIAKHMCDDVWDERRCTTLINELRNRNAVCEQKVRKLSQIFPCR